MYGNNNGINKNKNEDHLYRSIDTDYGNKIGTSDDVKDTTNFVCNFSNIFFNKKETINHNRIEPEYFETSIGVNYPLSILANPTSMKNITKNLLKHFEYLELIDWFHDEAKEFIFDGRIYSKIENAEFRIQLYGVKFDADRSMLELRRMHGDAFVFADFREKLMHYLTEKNYIDNDNNEDNVDFEGSQISQSSVTVENSNDVVMRFTFQDILPFNMFENNENNDFNLKKNFQKEQIDLETAKNLVFNAKDRSCYREIFREHVLTLRQIVDDEEDSKIVAQLETVFDDLLSPMISIDSNPLLDCWAIKTLLEIVLILLPKSQSSCSAKKIISIRETWKNPVHHPLGIATFIPSQQITRICDKCLKVLQEQEFKTQ